MKRKALIDVDLYLDLLEREVYRLRAIETHDRGVASLIQGSSSKEDSAPEYTPQRNLSSEPNQGSLPGLD